ncbi:discoidin domain-containing receptor tyrosine kinase B-like [Sitophilus oryzae]|uniref:Discoidin domain-containing receptor tyrosine kinase B-like n=1 Tax=Sitophilus oryzae TaxID=7048 RepID=A0A6J2XEC2_SITOR|nr:discoidin domain-containing receptor tyrosine kinase B-like [Sitophilus oryzae]
MELRLSLWWMLSMTALCGAVDPSQCIAPLGMENGLIKDSEITASSSFDSGNVGPQHGRVRTDKNGGAWCPQRQATAEPEEWIQIDLKTVHVITATETQGRFGNGQGIEYAEAYMLEYYRPRLQKWIRYHNFKGEEVIQGNINPYLEAKRQLDPPLWASKIRFYPYSFHKRTVCMRVELYGCRWTDGLVSYTMPQGDKRGANWEFYDFGYDGFWDGNELKHGLGQLTDGKFGHDDFKTDLYEGQTWVGWKNDTRHKPVELKFEFDKVREFSAVHIYCNNQFTKDVQVFSSAKVLFSIGGKRFNRGEPITFEYMEDKIFEDARNITIKLHHRVGKYVKLQLFFASKWIMVSEVSFESVVSHGNFTPEPEPTTTPHVRLSSEHEHKMEIPVPTDVNEPMLIAVVLIGITLALLVLGGIVLVIRLKRKKYLRSPNNSNLGFPNGTLPTHMHSSDGLYSVPEKDGHRIEAYGVTELNSSNDECYKKCYGGGSTKSSLRSTLPLPHPEENAYQEPYQAMKFAPYYSYSPVVMEMTGGNKSQSHCDNYDYAIPEGNTLPLLSGSDQNTLPMIRGRLSSNSCQNSKNNQRVSLRSTRSEGAEAKRSPTQQDALAILRKRLEETSIPEFPRHRLRMLSKLSEGAFGTVYIAEADGIAEYPSGTLDSRLVAIKFLGDNATEKEKKDFHRDVRILAALDDENIARVLGICSEDEPLCVVMEYMEHGDLCQFLKIHVTSETTSSLPFGVKSLSFNCLLYIATQIASGMRYLETLNFVHRDLATRNCLIGKAYQIKICDYGTYNELYVNDYYKVDGNTPLPIRWMSWEAVYQMKYTTKSDVWAFAVTLWEILTLCRKQPYDSLTDPEIMENLARLHCDDKQYKYLPRPSSNKDIYDLMLECWRRVDKDRPTFREIHMFLQRKNLGYAPV